MTKGKLILISTPLSDIDPSAVIPAGDLKIIDSLRYFVVENIRTARRFLKKINRNFPIDDSRFSLLDKHTEVSKLKDLLAPALEGHDIGLMSEAGAPAIADPGALLVAKAHECHVTITPLTGPSSLLIALMASGFNGQEFAFHGYLPIKPEERRKKIKQLESQAGKQNITQIFIETPYRNNAMMEDLLGACNQATKLCVASDLHGNKQKIKTKTISEWKKTPYNFHKIPAVFLIQ